MMKKMMFAALAAMAMVGVANAEQSYGVYIGGYVNPYSKDANPGDENLGYYSHYVMKQADAQAAMDTTDAVTCETMAAWLCKSFAANKASVIANAESASGSGYDSYVNQYGFTKGSYSASGSGLEDAIGVFFYEDGENYAFNVLANGDTVTFYFDSLNTEASSSGWTAVPEPTSGLLLLLGVAGLALKRKRV